MHRVWPLVPSRVKRRLGLAAAASVIVPWLVGEFVKTFHQAGLSADPVREALFVDILVIAVAVFALTMVLTVAMGCVVTAAMKGPQRLGDPFPDSDLDDDRR